MKSLLVAAAAVALSCPGGTFAQTYPAKPVRYIVPFPAGGSPDIVGRLLSERLGRMELFKLMTRIDVVHIAYKGAAPALADLIAGQVPISIANIPALLSPVQSGRARALAVTGAKRASQWPSVPTMSESGLAGYDVTSWYGVCAPAGTPVPVLDKLHADFTTALLAPELHQRLSGLVIEVAPTSREGFAAFIQEETRRWAKVVKDAGIAQQ